MKDDDDDAMPCGCVEYHYADCPLLTDRYEGPPEPNDDEPNDWRAYE